MTLVLAVALLIQTDFEKGLDDLITKLRSNELSVRDEARVALTKLVRSDRKAARPALKARLEKEKDADVKAALTDALASLVTLDDVKMEVVLPKDGLTLAQARADKAAFKIRITNGSDATIVLYRSWTLEVLDAAGAAVKKDRNLGRWGMRESGCFLAQHGFVEIAAGASLDLDEGILNYHGDMNLIMGFKLPSAGAYTLKLTYTFARDAFRKRCKDGCKDHDGGDKAWNRALEGERTFEANLEVKQ